MGDMSNRTFAISVESMNRELFAKLWLAVTVLRETDYEVIIGEELTLKRNIYDLRPDALLVNGANRYPARMREISDQGCYIMSMEEEGIIIDDPDAYHELISQKDLLPFVDKILVPGRWHARAVAERAHKRKKDIIPTGNPRFDLLQPRLRGVYDQESKEYVAEYGKYILINTNFVRINYINNKSLRYAALNGERTHDLQDEVKAYFNISDKLIQEENEMLDQFIQAVYYISNKFDTIVIRPHPKESASYYREEFQTTEPVTVEKCGDVRGWIAGSSVTIHNGCTTGVEAAVMEKPVIAYEPMRSIEPTNRDSFPNEVSIRVNTKESLRETIAEIFNENASYPYSGSQRLSLNYRLANYESLAATSIADIIKTEPNLQEGATYSERRRVRERIHQSACSLLPFTHDKRVHRSTAKYPGTSALEVNGILELLAAEANISRPTIETIRGYNELFRLQT